MALNPGSSAVWLASGFQRLNSGKPELAFEQLETALRLDPLSRYRALALGGLGAARFAQKRFADATPLLKQSVQLRSEWGFCYPFLAASYGHLGDASAAREVIARFRTTTSQELSAGAAQWPNLDIRTLLLDGIELAEGKKPPEAPTEARPP